MTSADHVTISTDRDGAEIAHVELANGKGIARLLSRDLERIKPLTGLNWFLDHSGSGRPYVSAYRLGGGRIRIAREIAAAGPGDFVIHRDGDALNLLPRNLEVTGRSRRRRSKILGRRS